MSDITIKQARAFLAAAEHKVFSRAAQMVFMSQPAFSRCIRELESELGQAVFIRTNHGVSLSMFGQTFLPHAEQLVKFHDEMHSKMTQGTGGDEPELRVWGARSVMHVVLPELVRQLRREFEQPKLQFEDASSARVTEAVLAGRADFGICTPPYSQTQTQPALHCTTVLEAPLGILASEHARLPGVIKSVADLRHLPLIRLVDDAVVNQTLRAHGVPFDAYFQSRTASCGVPGSFSLVRDAQMVMIVSGVGASHAQAADLRFVPLPGILPTIRVSIVHRADQPLLARHEAVKQLIQQSIRVTKWHPSVQCV